LEKDYSGLIENGQDFNLQYAMTKWRFCNVIKGIQQKLAGLNSRTFSQEVSQQLGQDLLKISQRLFDPKKFLEGRNKQQHIADMAKKLEESRETLAGMNLQNQTIKLMANDYIHKYSYSQMMIK